MNDQWYSRYRVPATNVSLGQNLISDTAFDFEGRNSLGTVRVSSLTSTAAPGYLQPRFALSNSPSGFSPQGRVDRVMMITNGMGQLAGILEVAFGQIRFDTRSNLLVTVRAVFHNTARSGNPGTFAISQVPIYLTGQLQLPGGQVRTVPTMVSAATGVDGTVQFVVRLPGPTEFCRLQASAYTLATSQTAWASLEQSFGTVVWLTAAPDVGDDKNMKEVKRAVLHFQRTGSLSNDLAVSFVLPTGGLGSPWDQRNLVAAYGTNRDYTLQAVAPAWIGPVVPGQTNRVTIPANSREATVEIVTVPDNLTESEVVRVVVLPDINYALGSQVQADVLIYDGPYWNVAELSASGAGIPSGSTVAQTVATALNNQSPTPQVVGSIDFNISGAATNGWVGTAWTNVAAQLGTTILGVPSGASLAWSPHAVSDPGWVVGVRSSVTNAAFRARDMASLSVLNPLVSGTSAGCYREPHCWCGRNFSKGRISL